MNAAEQLRNELRNSASFDKKKVIETVANGIMNGGYCEIIVPYNPPASVVYGGCHIECSYEALEPIKQFLRSEGFSFKTAYHPVSGRAYGYEVSL